MLRYYRVAWLNQDDLAVEGYLLFRNAHRIQTFAEDLYDRLADDPSGDFLGVLSYGRPQHGHQNTITAHRVLIPEKSLIGQEAQLIRDSSYYLWVNEDRLSKRWFEARMLETKAVLAIGYRQPRPLPTPSGGLSAPNILPFRPRARTAAITPCDGVRTGAAPGPQKAGLAPARLTRE